MSISPAADEHDSRSRGAKAMTRTEERNEALVLQAFDTLFNRRDYVAAQQFWSPTYIQHSAHIEPGREGLFNLVKASPADMRYENALTVANGDYVMLHSRFSNTGLPANWIVVDVVRLQNGLLAEHWDVVQDEVTAEQRERAADVRRHLPGTNLTRLNTFAAQRSPRNDSVVGETAAHKRVHHVTPKLRI
jgi:predicted SnoaL-like aldol condensation-catalyzing enzyme